MTHADLKLARLLVVQIQTEHATHLMFPADSAAWIISTTPHAKISSERCQIQFMSKKEKRGLQ